jgi:STAM-binding protein
MAAFSAASLGPRQGPMSIDDIVRETDVVLGDYTPAIPLHFWLRAASAIQKQAAAYERDGNEEQAFQFYYRHATLVMSKLPGHPEFRLPQHQAAWQKARADVTANLRTMEALKPGIKRRYEQHRAGEARRADADRVAREEQRANAYGAAVGGARRASASGERPAAYGYGGTRELDPAVSCDLAVQLAHNEYQSVMTRSPPSSSSGAAPGPTAKPDRATMHRRIQSGAFLDPDSDDDDLARQIVAVGQRREQAFAPTVPGNAFAQQQQQHQRAGSAGAPHYPSVPKKTPAAAAAAAAAVDSTMSWYETSPPRPRRSSGDSKPPPRVPAKPGATPRDLPLSELSAEPPPPSRPPKEQLLLHADLAELAAPPPPAKPPSPVEAPDTSPAAAAAALVPNPAVDPRKYTFRPSARTERGQPLRTIFLSPRVRARFLTIALANTRRNLETCGILCGRLISNAFFVLKLVIPEQEATSDTCDTVNESALFDYCDENDLMTLGWIHTHPSQTCFMSSRDLHTHGGYQVQLAESIAIVCAPSREPSYVFPSSPYWCEADRGRWGIFRLTDPPGLATILGCTQKGLFHPHAAEDVYTDALQPGHVREVENLPFDVVDLRPGSSWL